MGGEALFKIKKEGRLKEEIIPEKEVEIYEAFHLKDYFISQQELKNEIIKRIILLKGDFRQEEVIEQWKDLLLEYKKQDFLISRLKIKCSSGTYMRRLAKETGEYVEIPSLAFRIKRTKIFDK